MKTWKTVTILTLTIAAAALITASAYGFMGGFGYAPYGTYNTATTPNTPYNYSPYGYGGMMSGYYGGYGGYGNDGYAPAYNGAQTAATTNTAAEPYYEGYGCGGMMGGYYGGYGGYGNYGNYGYGPYGYGPSAAPATTASLNLSAAVSLAQNYVANTGLSNLKVTLVAQYSQAYYVQVTEQTTGVGAFELLVNPATGAVTPEPGANLMWNTKYGVTSTGMMDLYTSPTTTAMTITASQAQSIAQQYLNSYLPGTTTGQATQFNGYYTLNILNNGASYGLLSVNGYTGQTWIHNWLGNYIQQTNLP